MTISTTQNTRHRHDHQGDEPRGKRRRKRSILGTGTAVALTAAALYGVVAVALPVSASASGQSATAASLRPASVFILPSASRCVAGGRLTLNIREPRGVSLKNVAIRVNGNVFVALRHLRTNTGVTLHGLPAGSFSLSLSASEGNGRTVRLTVAYHSCSTPPSPCGCLPKPPVGTPPAPAPPPAPTPPGPEPVPTPGPSTPAPGAYTAGTNWMLFYVSPDSGAVQDVKVSTGVSCSTGGSFGITFVLKEAAITTSTSGPRFSGTEKESVIIGGRPAQITYSLEGQFEEATKASGTFREDIAYEDGTGETCTSNTETFHAVIESEGSQVAEPPRPGEYTAGTNWMFFYVSPDSSAVQDVKISTGVDCSNGGSMGITFVLSEAAIESTAAGSEFSASEKESAIIGGRQAEVTYTLQGHFHGFDAGGAQRAAGTFREDIAFEDGTHEACTTASQPFNATIGNDGNQAAEPPLAGSYSAGTNWMTFNVSPGGETLESIKVNTGVDCSNGGSAGRVFLLKEAPVDTNASGARFSGTETESAKIGGASVEITYTIEGHFHGFTAGGQQRADGTFREDIAYEDGSGETCTTDRQAFMALN